MNTTEIADSQSQIAKAAVKRVLEDEVWNAADRIGRPGAWFRVQHFNDDEMAGYAHGVHTALVCVAEELSLGELDTKQISAALGERLHRRRSQNAKLSLRRLNLLVEEIRAARIALIDDYQPVDYVGFQKPMQKRIWRMERQGVETDAESLELQLVQKEFRALCNLNCHLAGSREWQLGRLARQEKAQVAA